MSQLKSEDNLKYWVALNLVLAEKLNIVKKIIDHFSVIGDVFKARESDLKAAGVDSGITCILTSSGIVDKACREIDRVYSKGYRILSIEDKEYPDYLREIFDPPIVLYCAGKVETLKGPCVTIVGSRRPTPYGRAVAERIAQDLASREIIVVSGMARGIDSIAHWGALKEGKTVAVLGSGLDVIYPRENKKLFEKIIERGAMITEYPLKTLPLGFHFPLRNRILSGLSIALLVVEAAKKSGSLISARLALEQNREVMAVPGNITSEYSRGTNWLIKTGAKPVESWEDIAEELPTPLKEKVLSKKGQSEERVHQMSSQEKKVIDILKLDSLTHIDELVTKSDFSVSELLSILLNLELRGLISQSPGKYFQRKL